MHPQRAQMQLDFILSKIEDIANVEQRPAMEARTLALVVAPKPVVFQRLASKRDRPKDTPEGSKRPPGAATSEDQELDDDLDDDDEDEDDEDEDEDEEEDAEEGAT
jgi:hypothetical protein